MKSLQPSVGMSRVLFSRHGHQYSTFSFPFVWVPFSLCSLKLLSFSPASPHQYKQWLNPFPRFLPILSYSLLPCWLPISFLLLCSSSPSLSLLSSCSSLRTAELFIKQTSGICQETRPVSVWLIFGPPASFVMTNCQMFYCLRCPLLPLRHCSIQRLNLWAQTYSALSRLSSDKIYVCKPYSWPVSPSIKRFSRMVILKEHTQYLFYSWSFQLLSGNEVCDRS